MQSASEENQSSEKEKILHKDWKEDKKLKLSVKEFYKELEITISEEEQKNDDGSIGVEYIINKSLGLVSHVECNTTEKKLQELKKIVRYPNNYELASLAERSYDEKEMVLNKKDNLHGEKVLDDYDWILLTGAYHNLRGIWNYVKGFIKDTAAHLALGGKVGDPNGYFGAAYWNPQMQQIIIVHRGTENLATFGSDSIDCVVNADIHGIVLNQHVGQINSAVTFTHKIITIIEKIKKEKGLNIQLFITGHSLGGWLAPITAFSAKYLKKEGDNFVENTDSEETGCHASTVNFDGPGSSLILENIQSKLMNRTNPTLINHLDVTSYFSAPNVINACNPPVGDLYRVFIEITDEEKKSFKKMKFNYHLFIHSIIKIKGVFHPKTGDVLEDDGNLRIKKVEDWPTLQPENQNTKFVEKLVNGIVGQLILTFIPPINQLVSFGKFLTLLALKFKVVSKPMKWYNEINSELNDFFKLANKDNDFHVDSDNKDVLIMVGDKSYRTVRYKTQSLKKNYKNKQNLNVFTRSECQFLERYKHLERYQNIPNVSSLTDLFNILGEELKNKTIKLLEECEIREDGTIKSSNLSEFIPYIKRMLFFFPNIKETVNENYQNLPSNILSGIYQSASSSHLNCIKGSLDFEKDTFGLEDFMKNNNLKLFHVIHYNTGLGTMEVLGIWKHRSLNAIRINYHHVFLNLDRIFYFEKSLLIKFIKEVEDKYLLVIDCDEASDEKIEGFLKELFKSLETGNVKVILVTERDSKLSSFVRMCNERKISYLEKYIQTRFSDLTFSSQQKLLDEKVVIFQGKEVFLSKVVNRDDDLDQILDPEIIVQLFNNEKIKIGKPLASLGEVGDYYIDRKLVVKVKVKEDVLRDENMTDLFAISNINKREFLRLTNGRKVRNFNEKDPDRSDPIRFVILNKETIDENFEKLCDEYSDCNIHLLEKDNKGDLIWQRSHGRTLSGLRKYIENYENHLPEDKCSKCNTSIQVVDVADVSNFEKKFIIIAAEPGMGKTTALAHMGTQKADDSKWLIKINLVEYKDKLEQMNFNEEGIVTFLDEKERIEKENNISNTLAKKLLESRLVKSGNIVLLLDGFDEITFAGQKNILNLLKKLQETKIEKVFISTRLHLRNVLENYLSTFAYTLKPFSKKDQENFLKKFWKQCLYSDTDSKHLDNYIKQLLEFISNSIGDKERKFMGIPMQMRMVAEAFEDELENLGEEITFPEKFDMLELYDRFISTKYETYFKKKGADRGSFTEDEMFVVTKGFKEVLMKLAAEELFTNMKKNLIGTVPSDKEKQVMNLVGIAQFIDGKIVFTHRTFLEYFATCFLVNILNEDEQKCMATINFLSRELFEIQNDIIRVFLDHYLAKNDIHVAILKGRSNDAKSILAESSTNINVTDDLGRSVLHYAAQEEYCDIVTDLLQKGANVEADKLGKTALHYAARYNHDTLVVSCLLKEAKYDIDSKDNNKHTAVYYAAQQSNWPIVDLFLEKGANGEGLDMEKLLFHYTYKGNLDGIQNTVRQEKADLATITDNHGNTLLHIASQRPHKGLHCLTLEIVELLLDKGIDAKSVNNSGKPPITYAAENKHWRTVKCFLEKNSEFFSDLNEVQKLLLLEYSAEKSHWNIVRLFMKDDAKDNYFGCLKSQQKMNLLYDCINFNDFVVVEFLLKKGVKRNKLNNEQKKSIISYFSQTLNWEIVKLFMEDCDRDKCFDFLNDKQKVDCLYHIVSIGSLDITKFFLDELEKKQINFDNQNENKETCLHFATQAGQLNIVQYLVEEKQANINATTAHDSTPLHLAAKNGHLELVEYLVTKNADIFLSNKDSKTAIDIARDEGKTSHEPTKTSYELIEKFLSKSYDLYKELCYAIKEGNLYTVCHLIENNKIDINFKYRNGFTLLHMAARENKTDILKYLIGKGADVTVKDNYGNNALHWSSFIGQVDMLQYLVPPDMTYSFGRKEGGKAEWSCILIDKNKTVPKNGASTEQLLDCSEILCSGPGNVPVNKNNDSYFTQQLLIIIQLIATNHIDPNIMNNYGNTVLHLVSLSGSLDALKYLLALISRCFQPLDVDLRNGNNSTPLFFASNQNVAEYLVARGSDISTQNKYGNTPIHAAALHGHLDVVKYLIENGTSHHLIDIKNNDYNTPLHEAVLNNNLDVVKYLIEKGADLTAENSDGKSPKDLATGKKYVDIVKFLEETQKVQLFESTIQGELSTVRRLIKQGVNVDCRDSKNWTPLQFAIDYGHLELVKYLLKKGADVLAQNNLNTALHLTIHHDIEIEEMIRLILDKLKETQGNTDQYVNMQDIKGDTPLILAAKYGKANAASILLEHGSNVEIKNNDGMTALHFTAQNGHLKITKLLADKGANINPVDNIGREPIHVAALYGQKDVIQFFLNKGVRVNHTDKDGWIPLHYAICSSTSEVVNFLLSSTANDRFFSEKNDTTDQDGWIPLYYVTCKCESEIVNFLLSYGADINAKGKNGRSTLHLAMAVEKVKLEMESNQKMNILGPNSLNHILLDMNYMTARMQRAYNAGVTAHLATLKYLEKKANYYYSHGLYKEALNIFNVVFSIQKSQDTLGSNHSNTLMTQVIIAVLLSKLGNYKKALNMLKEVLEVQKNPNVLGSDHTDTLTTEHNIAECYYKIGKYDDAKKLYDEVLEKRKKAFRPQIDHPDILITRHHIARVLNNKGDHKTALKEFHNIFELQCKKLNKDHPDTLKTHLNIAFTFYRLGKYKDAKSAITKVLEESTKVLSTRHPDFLTMKHVKALILLETGGCSEALTILKDIYEIQKEILGEDHSDTLATKHDIASALYSQGRPEEALRIFREVLEKREEVLGPDHLYTSYSLNCVQSLSGKCNIQ